MFAIKTAKDFYAKLIEEFDSHVQDRTSSRHAINCAITAYHLHEWVWGDFLKRDFAAWKRLGIRDEDGFLKYLFRENSCFETVQAITNGSKHFGSELKTEVMRYAEQGYAKPGYFAEVLVVNLGTDDKPNVMQATTFLEFTVRFWKEFLENHGPYKGQLAKSRYDVS